MHLEQYADLILLSRPVYSCYLCIKLQGKGRQVGWRTLQPAFSPVIWKAPLKIESSPSAHIWKMHCSVLKEKARREVSVVRQVPNYIL